MTNLEFLKILFSVVFGTGSILALILFGRAIGLMSARIAYEPMEEKLRWVTAKLEKEFTKRKIVEAALKKERKRREHIEDDEWWKGTGLEDVEFPPDKD